MKACATQRGGAVDSNLHYGLFAAPKQCSGESRIHRNTASRLSTVVKQCHDLNFCGVQTGATQPSHSALMNN
jgi:hypothetical protein